MKQTNLYLRVFSRPRIETSSSLHLGNMDTMLLSLSNQPQKRFIGSASEHVQRVAVLSLVGCDDVEEGGGLFGVIFPLSMSVRQASTACVQLPQLIIKIGVPRAWVYYQKALSYRQYKE